MKNRKVAYVWFSFLQISVKNWVKSFISSEKKKKFSVDIRDKIYRDQSYVEIGSKEFKQARRSMLAIYGAKIKSYRQRLAELDRAAKEFGAVPIYVTQNAWGYWRKDSRIYGQLSRYLLFNAINDVTRAFCRSAGRFCIDVAGSYYFGNGDVYDQIHTTPQGSRKIAMEICAPLSQWIKASKLLK